MKTDPFSEIFHCETAAQRNLTIPKVLAVLVAVQHQSNRLVGQRRFELGLL